MAGEAPLHISGSAGPQREYLAPSVDNRFRLDARKPRQVVLPLALGQLARLTPLRKVHERRPKAASRLSECVLLTVLYTTFCDTFKNAASETCGEGPSR